ncbi:MAG: hypothetical protein RIF32_14510 [Leptospirales bacterium]
MRAYSWQRRVLSSEARRRRDAFEGAAQLMRPRNVRIWMRPFNPIHFEVLLLDYVGGGHASALWDFKLGNFEFKQKQDEPDVGDRTCPADLYAAGLKEFHAPWRVEAWMQRLSD